MKNVFALVVLATCLCWSQEIKPFDPGHVESGVVAHLEPPQPLPAILIGAPYSNRAILKHYTDSNPRECWEVLNDLDQARLQCPPKTIFIDGSFKVEFYLGGHANNTGVDVLFWEGKVTSFDGNIYCFILTDYVILFNGNRKDAIQLEQGLRSAFCNP